MHWEPRISCDSLHCNICFIAVVVCNWTHNISDACLTGCCNYFYLACMTTFKHLTLATLSSSLFRRVPSMLQFRLFAFVFSQSYTLFLRSLPSTHLWLATSFHSGLHSHIRLPSNALTNRYWMEPKRVLGSTLSVPTFLFFLSLFPYSSPSPLFFLHFASHLIACVGHLLKFTAIVCFHQ